MNSGRLYLSLLFAVIALNLSSCKKDNSYPITPEITFVSLTKYTSVSGNDSLELIFDFTDGDGDIGTRVSNSVDRDIFAKLFEKENGVFVEADLAAPLEYRMPFLEPSGNNNSLKGSVKINIDYNILVVNDTIRYELYIRDRADHKSNTITSSVIITRVE